MHSFRVAWTFLGGRRDHKRVVEFLIHTNKREIHILREN